MRRSMSACISSQMAQPHGRMTMVPRTGPVSASSARATTSWYHWGKSSPWGVRTAWLATSVPPPSRCWGQPAAYPASATWAKRYSAKPSQPPCPQGGCSEQGGGQVAAVAHGQRAVVAEDAEDVQHQAAGRLAALAAL